MIPVVKVQKSEILNFEMKSATTSFMNDWKEILFEFKEY